MDTQQNIALFQELLGCGTKIPLWQYDENGQLLHSNCPNEAVFLTAFSAFGSKDKMLGYAREHKKPLWLGTALGMNWGAAFEWEGHALKYAYVIGPVFFSDVSARQIEEGLTSYNRLELSIAWKIRFTQALGEIAVSPSTLFSRYLLMLHYCVTGEHLLASDITTPAVQAPAGPKGAAAGKHRDRHKVWLTEQALLQMVRTGDINYKAALNDSMLISSGVPVTGVDPVTQGKISDIVFCSIVCRAAIEGGLSPEEAYSLGDLYIQSCVDSKTTDDLMAIPPLMYDDFIHRVHKHRTNPRLSPPVQKCIDYIEMHLNERIRAADLAALVGYSEYYITHKFREETHYTVSDYIKFAKIERAKVLLASTDAGIADLAEQLGFRTRTYFSHCFAQVVGVSPAEYRAQNKKL